MSEIKALDSLRETLKGCVKKAGIEPDEFDTYWITASACDACIDEIEREISERYVLKDDTKLDKTAVQEYNLTVHVADGQTIEYNTELRHRCGAATSVSVAFRLE